MGDDEFCSNPRRVPLRSGKKDDDDVVVVDDEEVDDSNREADDEDNHVCDTERALLFPQRLLPSLGGGAEGRGGSCR